MLSRLQLLFSMLLLCMHRGAVRRDCIEKHFALEEGAGTVFHVCCQVMASAPLLLLLLLLLLLQHL
jgi:hypothetical protein